MKKSKKTLSIILALCMVTAIFPFSFTASAEKTYSGWYYDQLTNTEKTFYEAIASLDLESGSDFFDLTDASVTGKALTQDQLAKYVSGKSVLNADFSNSCSAFEYDHPELFYIDFSKITFRVGTNTAGRYLAFVCSGSNTDYYRFSDFSDEASVNTAVSALNVKVNAVAEEALKITGKNDEDTAVQRIRYVHNAIINGCRYVYPENSVYGEKVFTAYGCLILGESVCEGYSEAAKLILNKIGIECELVSGLGKEVNDFTSASGVQSHMWNAVKVGEKWYALDVTWDDPISVKRVTKNNISTPLTDAQGNIQYNDLCREKYFLVGSDVFYTDHTESKKIADFGRDFVLPELSDYSYGLGADNSGLVVEQLTLADLNVLNEKGLLSDYQYSFYLEYADIKETKYTVQYGTVDTTISYDASNPIGTVVTHTENGITTTYTVADTDTVIVSVANPDGTVTVNEMNGFIKVVVDPQFMQYTVPRYYITITEILDGRNPYFAVSYNNMNEQELNKQGMYLAYHYDYWDVNARAFTTSPWIAFYTFKDTEWATDIPGKTIVVGNGDGNYFAVADFYPAMLDKDTTNFIPHMFGNTPYKELLTYNQLIDWLNTDGTLNTDIFIASSEAYKGAGTIFAQPFVRVAYPGQNSITLPGETYDVRIEYDEPLKLADSSVPATYNVAVSAMAEFYVTNALDYAKITDFAWDGDKTITFKFTPSPMYNDNNCQYSFTFPGLVGESSNLPPRYYCILVEKPAVGLNGCPKCPPAKEFFTMGTPILIEDENLDNVTYYDGSKVTDNAKFGLTLVASKPDDTTSEIMEESAAAAVGKDILASSTYNIKLNLRNCQTAKVKPGQKVTIGLPYPTGYGPENEGVVFKAYHYKIDEAGNYIAEELDCYIGEYGLVVYAESFSPFAVVAVEKDDEPVQTKSVYAVASDNGTVSDPGIMKYSASDTVSYTFTPAQNYVLESVLVNGEERIADVHNGVLTLDYDALPDSTQINAVFTAESVIVIEQQLDFTPEFIMVDPHVESDWVTVYESCLQPGYRYTYCMSCDAHEEIQRINDVPALAAHTFGEWTVVTPATYTATGLETRECIVCKETQERDIPVIPAEPTEPDEPETPSGKQSFFKSIIEFFRNIINWFKSLFG